QPNTIRLTVDSFKKLADNTVFKETNRINGLSFSNDGRFLITSNDSDFITLYELTTAKKQRRVNLPKIGANDVKYLHTNNNVLLATRKHDCSIRHFSLF